MGAKGQNDAQLLSLPPSSEMCEGCGLIVFP